MDDPDKKARNHVRGLYFKTFREYVEWVEYEGAKFNIPKRPDLVYDEWKGWIDWYWYD